MSTAPPSTTDNSLCWRIWHGLNYLNGGTTFLLGSVILFPSFTPLFDTALVSAWLYTLGSATFLLADITEWLHYTNKACSYLIFSINFIVSVMGSLLYLTGSICFIPAMNQLPLGELQFKVGSTLIYLSQGWKLWRSLNQPGKSCQECYNEDISGFYVDLFAGLGGLMYFIGTFVLEKTTDNPDLTSLAALIYSFGGFFFFMSGVFMQKRYFCEGKSGYVETN
jgi:hypothetical protein